MVSADNLGSLALGGFKESCTATKMSWQCMATKGNKGLFLNYAYPYAYFMWFLFQFTDCQFTSRDKVSHKYHCSLVAEDSSGTASKEYGVNHDSILNELTYFHVCNGSLLSDVMHDLLEGALQYEVKLLLNYMTENCSLIIQELNSRLENVDLGYKEMKNKLTVISVKTMNSDGNSLKQNGE